MFYLPLFLKSNDYGNTNLFLVAETLLLMMLDLQIE